MKINFSTTFFAGTTAALLLALTTFAPATAHAVPIAIVDSGVDYQHPDLVDHMWANPKEIDDGKDHDHNGKAGDVRGWNFAESNNKVIDYKYLGTFSQDPYKFFAIQYKSFNGTITKAEKAWANAKRQDPKFIEEITKFANFVHGSHVSGIASKGDKDAKIMAIKIIPTEVKTPFKKPKLDLDSLDPSRAPTPPGQISKLQDFILRQFLGALSESQAKFLNPVGLYLWKQGAKVANCSFGTSTTAAAGIMDKLLPLVLRRAPTHDESLTYAKVLVEGMLANGRQFMVDAKDTIFVVAAGNDGVNNDDLPAYPANIKRPNAITVAATFGNRKLAPFSNYGERTVDVAAPGVGIISSIPGKAHLRVSGTSQAAPYVTNVIAKMMDMNSGLRFTDLRRIVMETSDKKDFLKGKVASGGIANGVRAVYAAKLALGMPVDQAIQASMKDVAENDVSASGELDTEAAPTDAEMDSSLLLPLPSIVQF